MPEPTQSPDGDRPAGHVRRHGRAAVAAAVAVTAVLVVVGIVALVLGLRGTPGSPQPAAGRVPPISQMSSPPGPATPSGSGASSTPPRQSATSSPGADRDAARTGGIGDFLEAAEPTSIEIPSIGVRSQHFVPLSVQRDGTISVPGTAQEVGLYDAGPTPGQLGPSVLAAHVDTPSGVPGIFHELRRVKAGDVVRVSRRDGSHLTFTVDRVAAYNKAQFPTELVYKGDFTAAEIRLVTCGGPTDSRNEYRDNVVVFGHLTNAS
jgi:sortase (surface protein transpeptidase)